MKIISLTDVYRKTTRELDGMREELRKDAGWCEQRRRRDYASLADVKRAQAQRRIMRPNL